MGEKAGVGLILMFMVVDSFKKTGLCVRAEMSTKKKKVQFSPLSTQIPDFQNLNLSFCYMPQDQSFFFFYFSGIVG